MKNKGFTLIELLGSITLLALIATIAFPAILNQLSNSQEKIDKSMQEYAISAAREYVNDNANDFTRPDSKGKHITVQNLIDNGYISESIINDEKNKKMKNDSIKITSDNIKYNYEYIET